MKNNGQNYNIKERILEEQKEDLKRNDPPNLGNELSNETNIINLTTKALDNSEQNEQTLWEKRTM